jgi:hypothetical protein
MIASAMTITAMMMMIPMLMAAIIRPPRHHKPATHMRETLTRPGVGQDTRPRPDQLERRLKTVWTPLGPAPRVELLHVLMLPDFERADRIGEFWGYPESRAFAELLIDCEKDRTLRAVLVGMMREIDC